MRKWKRVETADGPRFRSALAPHEAALLKSLVGSLIDMLDQRESSAPPDELEQITGMRTGNSRPPDDATLRRLLPDFHRPDDDDPHAAESLNAALRSLHEPEIIDAKRVAANNYWTRFQTTGSVRVDRAGRQCLDRGRQRHPAGAGHHARHQPGRAGAPAGRPSAGPHLDVYQWLTVLQEYLVLALMGRR
ncbi:hypothetical protein I552_0942 [Mycobacterium xenopi 3993]|nr:hypothetical protein I552_0942 [Mycobacterium xenopi 3993]